MPPPVGGNVGMFNNAASGAFMVLEWIAKAVKPIIIIGAFFGAIWLAIDNRFNGVK